MIRSDLILDLYHQFSLPVYKMLVLLPQTPHTLRQADFPESCQGNLFQHARIYIEMFYLLWNILYICTQW